MNDQNLLGIWANFSNPVKFTFFFNLWVLAILVGIPVLFFIVKLFGGFKDFTANTTELCISLGGVGTVTLKCNREVKQVAYQAWTELITRKAGLPIEPENDVIEEVYNSWYQLFSEVRKLIKTIPASELSKANTQTLISVLVDSLNRGLRPHLTKWQARFRRWYAQELEKEKGSALTPQQIQKRYPEYNELLQDLLIINQQMVAYANEVKKLFS